MTDVPRVALCSPHFERVENVEQLGNGDVDHYLTLFPGANKVPPVNIYAVSNGILGGGGLIRLKNGIFGKDDAVAGYYREAHPVWYKRLLEDEGELLKFDGPVATVVQPNWVYGHAILEMLPKMFLIGYLSQLGREFPIIVTKHAPPFLREMLEVYFDANKIFYYDADRQRISARFFIVPSMMQRDYRLHPAVHLLVEDLVERCRRRQQYKVSSKVFLSRSKLSARHDQRVGNPSAIDEIFQRQGFSIVHPEELSFKQQIQMYADADIIAGVAGSALHNSMFQKRGGAVVSVGQRNDVQAKICAFREQRLYFIDPPTENKTDIGVSGAKDNEAIVQSLVSFDVDLGKIMTSVFGGGLALQE